MNFENTLFRCSSLGYIMTNPRSGTGLSETCQTHLVDVYVSNRYGRNDDVNTKYMEKGNAVEEDSITLYSRVTKKFHTKNVDSLTNKWIKGTPDLFEGDTIHQATHIVDIKSSWDIYTFMRVATKEINKNYYWQLQGYMDLTGAQSATLAYCLVNTPDHLIEDEQRRLMYKMGVIDPTGNDRFAEACAEIERNMRFDDIPMHERLITFPILRNDVDIMKMHARVEECRKWLNAFEAQRFPDVKTAAA